MYLVLFYTLCFVFYLLNYLFADLITSRCDDYNMSLKKNQCVKTFNFFYKTKCGLFLQEFS